MSLKRLTFRTFYASLSESGMAWMKRLLMRKLILIALVTLFLSGCSLSRAWKWFDEMEWERDDQTVKIIELFIR